MRALYSAPRFFIVISALALVVTSCGPHHRRGGGPDGAPCKGDKHAMTMHHHGGGHGACSYKSTWFSEGAVRSNDGVCQACSAGKWVAAEGCETCDKGCDHSDCKGRKGKKSAPCHHDGGGHGHPHKHPHQNQ